MELLVKDTIVILCALFFTVTYLFSAVEKLTDWNGTIAYYKEHFKRTFLKKGLPYSIGIIVFIELIILLSLFFGLYRFIEFGTVSSLYNSYIMSAGLLLLFLTAQRIAKDYQGSLSILIYLIFNILSLYFLI